MTLVKHLLKRKKQSKEGYEYLEDIPNKLKGVMRESERSRTYDDLYPQTQEAVRKRKKKKGK